VTTKPPTHPSPADARARLFDERVAFARLRRDADPRERERLIETHLPLARHLASRYSDSEEPPEDLFQTACVGLIKAVDRYDPGRGFAFSSFALPTILGELRRHFRDRTWAVRVPRALQDLSLRVDRAATSMSAELRRVPVVRELAAHLGVSEEAVLEALEAAGAQRTAPLVLDDDDGEEPARVPAQGVIDEAFERAEQRATLDPLLAELDETERLVLRMRVDQDLTQTEIADRVGVSQMQVSRLIRRGIEHLQEAARVP
jgi:RNA polymerase sigma-B factor